jgi:hypothetical protein
MMRTLSAVAALTLLAAPAFAAEVKIDLTGKSPAAAYSKIVYAARAACYVPGADIYAGLAHDSCVTDTVKATLAKLGNTQLNNYVAQRAQFQQLAKL